MDVQHLDYDDESLVRAALQAAYPSERPVFSQRRGAQIIRAAAGRALEGGARRHPFVGGRIAAAVAVAFTLFAGTAGAASAALPGQRLYPIKHVVERAMVAIAGDDVEAARLELRFAERRLREATAIGSDTDQSLDPSLSQRFHEHLDAASSLAGDELAGEVEQLENSRDEQETGSADAALPVEDLPPAPIDPQAQPAPEDATPPEPTVTLLPEPSASPSPDPSAVPEPATSPSPLPTPDGAGEPATGEPDAQPSPRPAAPLDRPDEPPIAADGAH